MAKLACSLFLSFLFVAGLLVFILWLSLRPHRPRFHVTSFSFPNASSSDVTFDVTARNPNRGIGIYYVTAMEGYLFYDDQKVAAAALLPPFYQTPKNTTVVHGVFTFGSTSSSSSSSTAAAVEHMRSKVPVDLQERGEAWFRLELNAAIRFRVQTWDTHRHRMHVGCDVAVGANGVVSPDVPNRRCSIYFS